MGPLLSLPFLIIPSSLSLLTGRRAALAAAAIVAAAASDAAAFAADADKEFYEYVT